MGIPKYFLMALIVDYGNCFATYTSLQILMTLSQEGINKIPFTSHIASPNLVLNLAKGLVKFDIIKTYPISRKAHQESQLF